MWLKALILLLSLAANIWLWGDWTLSHSTQVTLALVLNSLLGGFIFIYPIRYLIKFNRIKELFLKTGFLLLIYIYIFVNMALSLNSFYGPIEYILPAQILLIAFFIYLKWQDKPRLSSKPAQITEDSTRTQTDSE